MSLEQIETNEITELHLFDVDDPLLDKSTLLCLALEKNTSLTKIRFDGDFLACLRNDNRSDLLQSLSKIDTLQELYLEEALVSIADITAIILKSKGLKVLGLKKLTLQGVQREFDDAEAAIKEHGSLKDFQIVDCRPAVENISLDSLIKQ